MDMVVPAFMISFLVAFSLIPLIIAYSKKNNLLDKPGGRKIHTGQIPALGGIAIFAGFGVSMLMWSTLEQLSELKYIYAGIVMVFFLGIRDDVLPIQPIFKIFWQIGAALTAMYFGGVYFSSLHGLLGIHEVPIWIGYPVTVFTFVVITNAFNLIDGINGLAGTVGVIVLFSFGLWFYAAGQFPYVILTSSLAGGILAFLKYNYTPARIFMGDTGALTIGFIMAVIGVQAIESNASLPPDSLAHFECPITAALTVMLYPLLDTIRVFTLRVSQGRSPFSPDKNHIHHLLIRTGNSHLRSVFIIASINVLLVVFLFLFGRTLPDMVALPALLLVCLFLVKWLEWQVRRYSKAPRKAEEA
jgi:UDP-N-acetylmuramyl pentapeptide phosphotransferase/UDP-N-acetylglucosamine-1-phosphate transferase